MKPDAPLRRKFALVWRLLDERTRRLVAASEALALPYGGVSRVHRACGLSRNVIAKGIREIRSGAVLAPGRVRRPGAGRKPLTVHDPELMVALDRLIEPDTLGDPQSPLRWVCKSTRVLAAELRRQRHPISHVTVAQLLHQQHYSLQGTRKTEEGADHPDRDAQFRHINARVKRALATGIPVLSVDTKKKELVGNYANAGRQWRPARQALRVQGHDFPSPDVPRAYPYGIYDVGRNAGFVNVGTDSGLCGRIDPRLVACGRPAPVPQGAVDPHHGGCGRKQWIAPAAVEMGAAEVRRRDGASAVGVSFPPGHQQVEQGRASPLLVHLLELAGRAAARLRDDRQLDRADDDREGPPGHLPPGPPKIRHRAADLGRGDEEYQPGT